MAWFSATKNPSGLKAGAALSEGLSVVKFSIRMKFK